MRHLAAYLLLVLAGKANPTAAEIKAVLSAAGIEGDDARIASLIAELAGKDVNALITEGNAQLAKFGGGGGGGGGGGAPAPSAAPAGGKPAEAAKPAEVKAEEKEESGSMGLDLFG
jgi:large subunit ribosomal protein LP2